MKKIGHSDQIGDGGVALIHSLVNAMGFVWHERKTDAGIDGEIELRNPVTGEVANRFLLVQSKASNLRFPSETDRSFHFLCDAADIDYWMAAQNPVLLICSHPNSGEAWWMHIQPWFADPGRRSSRRIDFDKRMQRLDSSNADRLLDLADPHGYAHVPEPQPLPEVLISNLVPVTIPETIFHARTNMPDRRELLRRLHSLGTADEVREDFIIRGDRLYTWRPVEGSTLQPYITSGVEQAVAREWADDGTMDQKRWLTELLNCALRSDIAKDCQWHNGRKIVYWRATPNLELRRIRSSTGHVRQVFKPKFKKTQPDQVSYYWHAALAWQFLNIEGEWHCALNPTVHFTRDGATDSLYIADYLSSIKRIEKNLAVLGHTQMWAQILRDTGNMFEVRNPILSYGPLVTFEADRGINDEAWKPGSVQTIAGKPARGDETLESQSKPDPASQPPLFEAA